MLLEMRNGVFEVATVQRVWMGVEIAFLCRIVGC
jgi:hypothetical protein